MSAVCPNIQRAILTSDFWLPGFGNQPMLPSKSGDIPLPVDIEFSLPSVRLFACGVWG